MMDCYKITLLLISWNVCVFDNDYLKVEIWLRLMQFCYNYSMSIQSYSNELYYLGQHF